MRSGDTRATRRRLWTVSFAVVVCTALFAAACTGSDDDAGGGARERDRGDCILVDVAASPEKIELVTDLARSFNRSEEADLDGRCIDVAVESRSSGDVADALAAGWNSERDGTPPVIWSPAASSWGTVLNQKLAAEGDAPMAPDDATPFMLTPLVIAMPQPMAEALGWPDADIGWGDILELSTSPDGWAAKGHPEWGGFRLGKTNPNFSTSGLAALIAQTYAATGTTTDLSSEDLANPAVQEFGTAIESSVVHYGDITMTFLNNWFRADRRGTAMTYASAVAVEEKSVIDYNAGNPDGKLDQGEEPRPPRTPLVAIYPSEGTLYSDNPFFVLDADWVAPEQRQAAELFSEFVQTPANQERVLEYGFRPGNPDVALGEPITLGNGVDPDQPATLLEVPSGQVMVELLDQWAEQRRGAKVMMLLDVSGSMGDPADPADPNGPTKLDLAKEAVVNGLDDFKADDLVGLQVFTTDETGATTVRELASLAPIGPQREALRREVDALVPLRGTPLYDVTRSTYDEMLATYDPQLINAVIVLTDGRNDDGNPTDDEQQLDELVTTVTDNSTGENSRPVRIFTIAYGEDADPRTLRHIAEASNATAYSASDATTINKVFTAVISNF